MNRAKIPLQSLLPLHHSESQGFALTTKTQELCQKHGKIKQKEIGI